MNAQLYFRFRQWTLLLLISWLQACQSPVAEAPENLIPETKMAQILTEIHLAEARVTKMNRVSQDSNTLIYKHLEKQIFRKYKVDTAAYSKSYTYYSSDPEQLADIYKQVTEKLEQLKKPVADSSKAVRSSLPAKLKKAADSSKAVNNKLPGRLKKPTDSSRVGKNRLPARLKNLKQ